MQFGGKKVTWKAVRNYLAPFFSRKPPVPSFTHRWLGQIGEFREHHPIFSKFQPFKGDVPVEYEVDFIGTRTRSECRPSFVTRATPQVATTIPPIDEEYFEWADVLVSVLDAKKTYTMVELGAGYGRWAVRAALAAKAAGIEKIKLGLVEAEPAHLLWLRQHLVDNQIEPSQANIYEAAVSDETGFSDFYVGMPDDFSETTAKKWYGQAMSQSHESVAVESREQTTYFGREVVSYVSGWKAIQVRTKSIRDILSDYDEIDLLDLDVQGHELNILRAGVDMLDRVKRLHIGTHGHGIERGLRSLLGGKGWLQLRDYTCGRTNSTPFGDILFNDGVQTWINPDYKLSCM